MSSWFENNSFIRCHFPFVVLWGLWVTEALRSFQVISFGNKKYLWQQKVPHRSSIWHLTKPLDFATHEMEGPFATPRKGMTGGLDNGNSIMCSGRGRFGGQTAGGHPDASPWPRWPLFAVPAWRELESACRLSCLAFCETQSLLFQGLSGGGGVSSSLRSKPSAAICSV